MMKSSVSLAVQTKRLRVTRLGAVLVLVLFFIVLAGGLAILMSGSASQLARTTRSQHEAVLLRQLVDSGRDWLHTQETWNGENNVVLDGGGILPEVASGDISLSADPNRPEEVFIEAKLILPTGTNTRSTKALLTVR